MKKYDEYKDSGVAWIGDVPKHWEVLHLKHSLDGLQDGTHETYASVDVGKVLLSAKNVTEHGLIIGESERTISDIDYKEIVSNGFPQQGDILLCCVGTLGRCCIFENPFPIAFQRSVTFLRTNSLLSNRMLLYILRNKYIDTQFQLFAKTSAQSGVYMGDLKDFYIVVPPITEQAAISTYLDTHCAKIDNLISIQQKRIALLQELKQSVITHAVTKGLNPMKPSGVEWIGEVPKHWEVMPFKRAMTIYNGSDYKHIQVDVAGYPVIGSGGEFARASQYVYDGEVVLLGRKGTIDKPMYYNGKFWTVDTMFYAIPKKHVNCKYLYYQALIIPFDRYATSTALPSMTQTDLNFNIIGLPPTVEQAAIASYLNHKCATIDTSIFNAQHQIELLQEYKQSLITEVVTGKRKVTDN